MSRIGRLPIDILEGVTIRIEGGNVEVSGKKGKLVVAIPTGVTVEIGDKQVKVAADEGKNNLQGLIRTLVNNAVVGVTNGWRKNLELSGTGYRANTNGSDLNMALGFSHPIVIKSVPGISFEVAEGKISVLGIDKAMVGEVAAKIRALRPADPYKLKGLKYEGEKIIKKAGKAAKAGATAGK
jgi:large subunit ribosomal protein L6